MVAFIFALIFLIFGLIAGADNLMALIGLGQNP